jgi:serine/threonine-protein kinase
MVASHNPCDPNRLRQLLANRLPESNQPEVEAHLQQCKACQAKLDQLAGGAKWWKEVSRFLGDDSEGVSASYGPTTSIPGQALHSNDARLDFLTPSDDPDSLGRLGAYEVTEVIGRGGFGVVLKAFDPALHRLVAIKVLAAELATSGAARRRFAREARAAAAVLHEHVVPVHAVDSFAGLPYLVMAYVPGKSLQDRLDQNGPLDLREILRIGMQTAAGLAAAHAQGLVHRDIKPSNILLENGVERVKITDFGLARAVDDASLTQSGVVTGTPQYMAPEQARGEAVDHRADLFSLGSTLYAMCTGRPPFRAETAMAVLRRVSDESPTPIRAVNPDAPRWLARIVERLHAKDPNQRFQTAAEVADVLGKCLAHLERPDDAPLPSVAARAPARGSGRAKAVFRWLALAAAACIVAALGAAIGVRAASLWRPPAKASNGEGDSNVADAGKRPTTTAGRSHRTSADSPAFKHAESADPELDLFGWLHRHTDDLELHMKQRSPERLDLLWDASVSDVWKQLQHLEQDLVPPSR